MPIDMASVYAKRFEGNPQVLQAAVLGQAPIPGLDPYTALRSLQLIKESQMTRMAQAAQQPTQAPSLVNQAVAQPVPQLQPQMPQGAPQSQGLAGMPAGAQGFAPGGIVSFANGGMGEDEMPSIEAPSAGGGSGGEDDSSNAYDLVSSLLERAYQTGDPVLHRQAVQLQLSLVKDLAKPRAAEEKLTPEQEAAETAKYVRTRQAEAGESPFKALREEITTARGERAKNLERAQGVAFLKAARAALQPGGTARGLAAAASEFGGSYEQALQADRAERRSLANMEMNIADAERKERMGLYGEARALRTAAAKEKRDADRFEQDRRANLVRLLGNVERGVRPSTSGAGKTPSLPQVDRRIGQLQEELIDRSQKDPDDPQIPVIQQKIASLTRTLEASKTTESGPGRLGAAEAELERQIGEKVKEDVTRFGRMPSFSPVYKRELIKANAALAEAEKSGDKELVKQRQAEVKAVLDKFAADQREFYRRNPSLLMRSTSAAGAPAPGSARPAPAAGAAMPAPPAGFDLDQK